METTIRKVKNPGIFPREFDLFLLFCGLIILLGLAQPHTIPDVVLYNPPADGDMLTIDHQTYEFDWDGATTPGHIQVPIGVSLRETADNLAQLVPPGVTVVTLN